jgi:hypothetical protein
MRRLSVETADGTLRTTTWHVDARCEKAYSVKRVPLSYRRNFRLAGSAYSSSYMFRSPIKKPTMWRLLWDVESKYLDSRNP